jgi:hypothetical protein
MPTRPDRKRAIGGDHDARVVLVKLHPVRRRPGVRGATALVDAAPFDVLRERHPDAKVQALFAPAVRRRVRAAERQRLGARGDERSADDHLFLEVTLPKGASRERVLEQLSTDPRVEYAVRPPKRSVPRPTRASLRALTDPRARHQWYLGAAGFPALWKRTNGLRWPSIAILDQGVHRHLDLDIGGRIDIDVPAKSVQEFHGTMVAGILGAEADNGIGIMGASRGRVIAFRVMDHVRLDYQAYFAALKACANDRIRVINLSMYGGDANAMETDLIHRCITRGSVVIAAAGNHGSSEQSYPASIPGVVGVGAVDVADDVWSDSGRGSNVWIAAPGVNMLSTTPRDDYKSLPGTSFAAPLVSAAAAGLFALRSNATRDDVVAMLRRLTRLGGAQRDPDIGYGVLDLRGA